MSDIWSRVHDERRALIADLADLPAQAWEQPSLAAGWTIHDVAAHLVDNARTTPLRLLVAMAKARFDFDWQNANGVAAAKGSSPEETLQRLRDVASRRSGPPAPKASRLVEEIAHGEDVRRPWASSATIPSRQFSTRWAINCAPRSASTALRSC